MDGARQLLLLLLRNRGVLLLLPHVLLLLLLPHARVGHRLTAGGRSACKNPSKTLRGRVLLHLCLITHIRHNLAKMVKYCTHIRHNLVNFFSSRAIFYHFRVFEYT